MDVATHIHSALYPKGMMNAFTVNRYIHAIVIDCQNRQSLQKKSLLVKKKTTKSQFSGGNHSIYFLW